MARDNLCDFEVLSAYIDGVLDLPVKISLEDHLLICPVCQLELQKLEKIRGIFDGWLPELPKPFFMERLKRKLETDCKLEGALSFWQDWMGKRFVPAALVVISFASLLFLSQRLGERPEPMTVDGYLNGSLDEEVLAVSSLPEASLSKDRVLSIMFYSVME